MFRSTPNQNPLADHAVVPVRAAARKAAEGVAALAALVRVEGTLVAQVAADHAALRRNGKTNSLIW